MAIYRPPPSPHIGGHQPLAPRELPPIVLAAPGDPSFAGSRRGVVQIVTARIAWISPPPRPWFGWKLNPALEAVPTHDPPFGQRRWLSTVLHRWEPGPPSLYPVGKRVPRDAVDNPPFGRRDWLSSVLRAWIAGPPQPQVGWTLILSEAVDNPPFGRRDWLSGTLSAWQPSWQPPQLRVGPPLVEVGPPPDARRWLFAVLAAWQVPPPPQGRWGVPPVVPVGAAVQDKLRVGLLESVQVTDRPRLGGLWWE